MGSSYCPSWLFNSVYESPCTVWTKLSTVCTSDFVVPSSSIDLSNYHAADNRCQCNIVAYNLMSACATCTVGYSSPSISGTTWSLSQVSAYVDRNSYSYYGGSYYRDNYVGYIPLLTGGCLLIAVGFAWCCTLAIFWNRERERSRTYGQIATHFRFGGIGNHPPFQPQNYTALRSHEQFRYPPTHSMQHHRPPPFPPPPAQADVSSPRTADFNAEPVARASARGGYTDNPEIQEVSRNPDVHQGLLLSPSIQMASRTPEEGLSPILVQQPLVIDRKGKGREV
ncbi:hypothetical protein FRB91_005007 [Serendipita sp. 411]|nr:hypothetical protein FRB91_005007 [Serendipita sp. 411]